MSHHVFFKIFRIKIRAQARIFSPYELFFIISIDVHMVHEREKCTFLRSYISKAVNVGAELNVYGNVS